MRPLRHNAGGNPRSIFQRWHDLDPPITEYRYRKTYKPLAILIFILLFIAFSIYNTALLGYSLQPIRTIDPNTTEAEDYWFNNKIFTFGDQQLEPDCQGELLQVGDQFMTTNMGLSYTVWQVFTTSQIAGVPQQYSSVAYLNNTLENCRVNTVNIYLKKADASEPPATRWYSWMFNTANIDAQCDIVNEAGIFTVRFGATYDRPNRDYDFVAIDNYTTHASVWWGTRLVDNYFRGMTKVMATLAIREGMIMNGQLTYTILPDTDIRSYEMFDTSYWLIASNAGIANGPGDGVDQKTFYNVEGTVASRPLTEGAWFTKVFSSLVLVDLGQAKLPNLLLDADLLQYALDPQDDFNRLSGGPLDDDKDSDWWRWRGISPPNESPLPVERGVPNTTVTMKTSYDAFKDLMGPLGTKDATIFTQYSCVVPQRKSNLTIFIQVLIADYVLIETCIAIASYFKNKLVQKTDTRSSHVILDDAPPSPDGGLTSPTEVKGVSSSSRRLLDGDLEKNA